MVQLKCDDKRSGTESLEWYYLRQMTVEGNSKKEQSHEQYMLIGLAE
jgi:hypothetical protein